MSLLLVFNTILGWMGVEYSQKGLTRVILPKKSRDEVILQVDISNANVKDYPDSSARDLPGRLQDYLTGNPVDFTDELDLDTATVFQKEVWKVTRSIPYGQTRSYAWVADQVKCNSARAVGQALSKNPVPIVVPCHRVIKSDGSLGGFSAGLELKKILLNLES